MKKILITGEKSYIGTSFDKWLKKNSNNYSVDFVNVRGNEWRFKDFGPYDVILHVAGIVHKSSKETSEKIFYDVNTTLTSDIAKKAVKQGVKQFIFISTMSVYEIQSGEINLNTDINPKLAYGKSKFLAEQLLEKMVNENFKVAIIRPPMVYGKNAKGNLERLIKLAKILPFFINTKNKRSMIYIDTLSYNIEKVISMEQSGLFFVQDNDLVNTYDFYKYLRHFKGKKTIKINFPKIVFDILPLQVTKKLFCDLYYDENMLMKDERKEKANLRENISNMFTEGDFFEN